MNQILHAHQSGVCMAAFAMGSIIFIDAVTQDGSSETFYLPLYREMHPI